MRVENPTCEGALGGFEYLGFSLFEPDDHFLFLLHYNMPVAVFSQEAASRDAIMRACAEINSRTLSTPQ